MAKLFYVDLDLQQNTLIAPQIDNQSSAPSTPVDGQIYFNTVSNRLEYWDGTQWVPVIDSTLTVASGSTDLLDITANEISVKNLLVTDVTVNAVHATIAAFVAAEYTVGTEFQEGDIIILTSATDEADRTYIHNGGTAVTVADFTRVTSTLTDASVRGALSGGDGITYNSGTGEIETSVDDSTIELSAADGSGVLQVKADGITDTHIDWGTGAGQVNAEDLPVIDSGANFTATDVEGVLLEIFNTIPGTQDLSTTLGQGNTTGANDISVDSGQQIIGTGTSNELDLNASGAWQITNDAGVYGTGYVYGDATSAYLAVGSASNFTAGTTSISMSHDGTGMTGTPYMYLSNEHVGVADSIAIDPILTIKMADITAGGATASATENIALFLNSGGATTLATTINTGVDRSLALGGNDMTLKTSNRPYANGYVIQPAGSTFEMDLQTTTPTADRVATFQDASGTVAYLTDIPSLTNYTQKVVGDITGDGATTSFAINHAFADQWVQVEVFQAASPFAQIQADIELTDANNATVKFDVAPAIATNYKVVIVG